MGKKKPTMIYAVEQGDYSDYHIVGVYSTRPIAEKVIAMINGGTNVDDKASLAEWELDANTERLGDDWHPFHVLMRRDGSTEKGHPVEKDSYAFTSTELRLYRNHSTYDNKEPRDLLIGYVWGHDFAHAVKIANDRRTQLIAEDKWPTA